MPTKNPVAIFLGMKAKPFNRSSRKKCRIL